MTPAEKRAMHAIDTMALFLAEQAMRARTMSESDASETGGQQNAPPAPAASSSSSLHVEQVLQEGGVGEEGNNIPEAEAVCTQAPPPQHDTSATLWEVPLELRHVDGGGGADCGGNESDEGEALTEGSLLSIEDVSIGEMADMFDQIDYTEGEDWTNVSESSVHWVEDVQIWKKGL